MNQNLGSFLPALSSFLPIGVTAPLAIGAATLSWMKNKTEMEEMQYALDQQKYDSVKSSIYHYDDGGVVSLQGDRVLDRSPKPPVDIDKLFRKNKNVPFIQRILKGDTRSIQIPGEKGRSTHIMSQMDNVMFPQVQEVDGKLAYYDNPQEAYQRAMQTGDYIKLGSDEEALWASANYKNSHSWSKYARKEHNSKFDLRDGKYYLGGNEIDPGKQASYYKDLVSQSIENGSYNDIDYGSLSQLKTMLEDPQNLNVKDLNRKLSYIRKLADKGNFQDKYADILVPKFADGGVVEDIPLQAEKGEKIVLQDGQIVNVKADKLHKDMDKMEITDILPKGTLILSDRSSNSLTRLAASKHVLGYSRPYYNELEPNDGKVEEITPEFIFGNKKKMTPAEYAEALKKQFPVDGDKNDIWDSKTNLRNLQQRMKYIGFAKDSITSSKGNEVPKAGGGYDNPGPLNMFSGLMGGGNYNYDYYHPRVTPPLPGSTPITSISRLPQYIGGGSDSMDFRGMEALLRGDMANSQASYQNQLGTVNNLFGQRNALLGVGTGIAALSQLFQDRSAIVPQVNDKYVNQMQREVPQYLKNQLYGQIDRSSRSYANAIARMGSGANSMAALASLHANVLRQKSDAATNFALQDIDLNSRYLQAKDQKQTQRDMYTAQALQQKQQNQNSLLASLGDLGVNFTNQFGNSLSEKAGIMSQLSANKNAREGGIRNALLQLQLLQSMFQS